MKHQARLLCLALLAATPQAHALSEEDSNTIMSRLRSEGPLGWEYLEKEADATSRRATVTDTITLPDGSVKEEACTLDWRLRPGCVRQDRHELAGKLAGRVTVSASNELYFFKVTKENESQADWRYVSGGAREKTDGRVKGSNASTLFATQLWFYPTTSFSASGYYRLRDALNDPKFRFLQATRDGDLIRVSFASVGTIDIGPKKQEFRAEGFLLFDPLYHWALRLCKMTRNDHVASTDEISLSEPDQAGHRTVTGMVIDATGPGGGRLSRIVFEPADKPEAPPEDFRLAAFNLPDMLGPLPKPFPTTYVLLGAGIACAIVAAILLRRSRAARKNIHPAAG